jgi:hypothetical protein
MAALLMAIGFSVDYIAHISYHYYKTPKGVSLLFNEYLRNWIFCLKN